MKKNKKLLYLLSRDKLKIISNYRKTVNEYMITEEGEVYNRTSRTPLPVKRDRSGDLRVILENTDGTRSAIKIKTLLKYAFSDKNKRE